MTRKSRKHCVRHTEPLDCCFDLIRSHQQYILCSLPLETEPATTGCRTKTLPLNEMTFNLEAKSMYAFKEIVYDWLNEKLVSKYPKLCATVEPILLAFLTSFSEESIFSHVHCFLHKQKHLEQICGFNSQNCNEVCYPLNANQNHQFIYSLLILFSSTLYLTFSLSLSYLEWEDPK